MAKAGAGKVVWFEIPVKDVERAKNFYRELFNWSYSLFVDFQKDYWKIDIGQDELAGGFIKKTTTHDGSMPLIYFSVKDITESLKKAEQLGGKVITGKTMITKEAGYFARLSDPDQNTIAIWSQD